MNAAHDVLAGLQVGILVAGSVVSFWAFRRSLQSPPVPGSKAFAALGVGFALLTAGAAAEGVLYEFMGWSLTLAHAAEAVLTAVGFAVILVAILRFRG